MLGLAFHLEVLAEGLQHLRRLEGRPRCHHLVSAGLPALSEGFALQHSCLRAALLVDISWLVWSLICLCSWLHLSLVTDQPSSTADQKSCVIMVRHATASIPCDRLWIPVRYGRLDQHLALGVQLWFWPLLASLPFQQPASGAAGQGSGISAP